MRRSIVITPEMAKLSTLQLFRSGFDTLQIAIAKGKPESTVYRWLHEQRTRERIEILKQKSISCPSG